MSRHKLQQSENRFLMLGIVVIALIFVFFASAVFACVLHYVGIDDRPALVLGSIVGFMATAFLLTLAMFANYHLGE